MSYPRNLPDIFKGTQLTIIGRYRNPVEMNHVRLGLTGKSRGSSRNLSYNNLNFPLREEANDFLPRLWATRRVGWLIEQIRLNGEQSELKDEIVDLGTRYGIVTPYTSYLALEPGEAMARRDSFSNRPGFVTGRRSVAGASPPPAPTAADMAATTGQSAVTLSKQARAKQEVLRVEELQASSVMRSVGRKTFYLRDEVWTDSEFKAGTSLPETVVRFGSEQYFALLKQKPQLANFFSLGEKVVVVFEGRVYKVIQ